MSKIRINIDGKELRGFQGQTVLEIAKENGIEIPTLCHDDRVKMYGSCGVCVVESATSNKLLRSCSTYASHGMVITTNSPRVHATRKSALELMLSDHTGDCRPPCVLACPAQTDCQGYAGLISLGEYEEALKLVKDKIPLPGSIGRVCPHPCEDACRRKYVEEPISIAALKAFVADKDMENETLLMPKVGKPTGKRVGIIGGGPGGLTAAYFLRQLGHEAEIFDMMPNMGGMLYYGIPEYRLPKDYLTREVNSIRDMGVTFHNNVRIGTDVTLDWIRNEFDAVIVAVGAWSSTSLRTKGEELEGVVGGIDFLQNVALNNELLTGKHVAVVGGGNTAMDACRTAVRLGAEKVYNVYRRTRHEMPAEDIEILEAEEEGVIFKHLTNPTEVFGKNGKVSSMEIQIMELGEPDASGRRAPIVVEGKTEILEVDTVIVAIGQKLDSTGLEAIETTDWKTISADEATFRTNLNGVFAIGDATNNGADIAISAIGDAKKAVEIIDSYLNGTNITYKAPYLVTKTVTESDFEDHKKIARAKMPHRTPKDRKNNFLEVNFGLSDEAARTEGERCLECGCHDYFECKLIQYSQQYAVAPAKFDGDMHARPADLTHAYIERDPNKCILCGLCVRICEEVVGATALGLVNRGFDTVVAPALELPLNQTDCISCGQCVHVCPTGALMEKMQMGKQVPVAEKQTITTCSFCGVGCQQKLASKGNLLSRALPYNKQPEDALLCLKGRLGFAEIAEEARLLSPLIRNENGELTPDTLRQAAILTSKKFQSLQAIHGADSVGVAVSDRYTMEEATLISEYASNVLGTDNIFSFGKVEAGLRDVLGKDASTATFEELENTDYILLVHSDPKAPHLIAGLRMKKAVNRGAKLVALNSFDSMADEFATEVVNPGENLELLSEILKVVLEESPKALNLANVGSLKTELSKISASEKAITIAKELIAARNAIIVFEQNRISADAARILGNIAVASGHESKPRSGIIQLKSGANGQGLAYLDIRSANEVAIAKLKGLIIFGEDLNELDTTHLEFLAVHDLHLTETAKKANVVFPAVSYAETTGTFINSVGEYGTVRKAINSPVPFDTFDIIKALAEVAGRPLPYRNLLDITGAWKDEVSTLPHITAKLSSFSTNTMILTPISTNHLTNRLTAMAEREGL